ncbi:MAG: hypothetical protein JW791_01450 [Nanoarchaeota archaeon]|nr:hypothetical protein [Nanoarchaeota archaeon]
MQEINSYEDAKKVIESYKPGSSVEALLKVMEYFEEKLIITPPYLQSYVLGFETYFLIGSCKGDEGKKVNDFLADYNNEYGLCNVINDYFREAADLAEHVLELIRDEEGFKIKALEKLAAIYNFNSESIQSFLKQSDETESSERINLIAYNMIQSLKKSKHYVDELIKLDPSNAKNYYNKFLVVDKLNLLDEIEESLLKLIELEPECKEYYSELSVLYLRKGDEKKSREVMKKMPAPNISI